VRQFRVYSTLFGRFAAGRRAENRVCAALTGCFQLKAVKRQLKRQLKEVKGTPI
jgi:hypothetical protein